MILVFLILSDEKEGVFASAAACAWAVEEDVPLDIISRARRKLGLFVVIRDVAQRSEAGRNCIKSDPKVLAFLIDTTSYGESEQ